LTGMKYGSTEDPGSVAHRVNHKLNDYADKMKSFVSDEKPELYK